MQLRELEGLKKEHDDRFTGIRASLDATLKVSHSWLLLLL